ncbi:hypothetical protein COCNU_06G011510 [Cocos nucifera]|uniref:NBS-LRR resistance protein n=1 Tax=Cocos nucifera TaxID=13894 RepID=A0A8K0ICH0_COCNU|nr:hypothetical protein COCNU_06G011510 [Cocos nucifera]
MSNSSTDDRISHDVSLDGTLWMLKDATRNKRFLFVLDDVWDETGSKWKELRGVLTSGAKGSIVLVTTQSPVVAEVMGTMDPLESNSLQQDDFWRLFEHSAFGENILEEERREKLQTIGRKISEKVHGLPLAGKMWMAQGFIQNQNQVRMRMEDIGSQIFDELTSRYFFLPTLNNRYVMYDLIRELAVYVSLDKCLLISDENGEIPETIRHLT